MVSKRRLAASLLLLGVAFVGTFHAVVAVAFDTGLASAGAAVTGLSVLALVVVNLPALGEGDGDDEGDWDDERDGDDEGDWDDERDEGDKGDWDDEGDGTSEGDESDAAGK